MPKISLVSKNAFANFFGKLRFKTMRDAHRIRTNRRSQRRRHFLERLESRDLLASVVMQSATADGGTLLSLTYDVREVTAALNIGFYRSADSSFGSDALLDSVTINSPQDLTLGVHVKTLAIGGGADQVALPGAGVTEVPGNYTILAVAHPSVIGSESTAVFTGVYHAPLSDVFVHGRNGADSVLIDSTYRVTLNGTRKTYGSSDVTGFRVRGNDGNDVIDASTAAKSVWIYGGAGDDTLKGGNVSDTLEGGLGNDVLVGGKGNDSLDGGEGSDSYLVAGTIAGTDIYQDKGTLGIDQIIASASSTNITLSSAFSLAVSGIEAISANGFASVSVLGTSSANTFNLSGMTLTGLAIIDSLAGADTIVGSDGDDFIRGGTGNDSINAGLGQDIVYYAGAMATYSIIRTGDVIEVKDLAATVNGNDGTDLLRNVELLRFLDADFRIVVPTNTAPIAVTDSLSITEDTKTNVIPVLANDSDPDINDALTVISASGVGLQGVVSVSTDGLGVNYEFGDAFQYLSVGATAVEVFNYTIQDKAGLQATANVTATIIGVNDGPVAVNDSLTITDALIATVIPVLANDTDIDANDTKRVVSVNSVGVRGVVQVATGGTGVLFYPNNAYVNLRAGESAIETMTYTMADSAGVQSTATLVVTVTGTNSAPVAVGDVTTISENAGPTTIEVLFNDTDVDLGDTKTIVSLDGTGRPASVIIVISGTVTYPVAIPAIPPVIGTISISPTGQIVNYSQGNAFQYLRAGQSATDRFQYTMADSLGAQSSNWVTITVTGANDAPTANPDGITLAKNSAPVTINVLANDTDVDSGDTKTVLAVNTTGLLGIATVSVGGTNVVYSVGNAFLDLPVGQTVTETFTYTMVDGAGAQSTATVNVLISGTNAAPIAVADVGSVTENGSPLAIDALMNDTDIDVGDTKTVVSVHGAGLQGAVSITSGGTGIVYTIGNAFQSLAAGATATETFSYTIRDAGGAQSTAAVTVTVTGLNDSPVAIANTATAFEDGEPVVIDVLANDTDVDLGDTKQVVSVLETGLLGTVSVAPNGTEVVYSVGSAFQNLKAGAIATEVFSYTMRDASGAQSTANVTVTITGVNDSPVATDNVFTVSEDATASTFAVLANDTDPDVGDTKRVVSVNTSGLLGTATVATNGTGVIYSADNAFQYLTTGQIATETFSYTMVDSAGVQSTATVTVTITGATDGPKAINDQAYALEDGGPIVINVLANDTNDLNPGDALTITSIDGNGQYASITLIIIYGVGVGQYHPGFQRLLGQASIAPDGHSILYTPMQSLNAGEIGTDLFRYTITGTGGGISTGTVTVTVTGANDAPTAVNDSATVPSNASPTTINILANDIDLDNRIDPPPPIATELGPWDVTPVDLPDIQTIVAVNTIGLQGSVAISAGGNNVVYTVGGTLLNLPFGDSTTETFTYTVRDSAGAESTATVTVNVIGVNHAPIALADVSSAIENGAPVSINVLANDSDSDIGAGDSLTLLNVNGSGLQGTVQIVSGQIIYSVGNAFQSLRAGVTATEIFNYTVSDSRGAQSTANVTVTIIGANDAPVAVANVLSLSEDAAPTTIAVLANDTDIDAGDTKTVISVNTSGLQGTVAIASGGASVIYTVGASFQALNSGESAIDTFSYTIVDSAGAQSTAMVTITIIGANEPIIYVEPPLPPAGAIVGSANDDIMVGTDAADIIYGQLGDDDIDGGSGDDTIFGGAGKDNIVGGAGNDIINGGSDADDLTGGTGADIFRYYLASESTVAAADKIKDFKASEGDKIDLSLIDSSTVVGGNNAFVMSSSFTMIAGQLVISTTSSGVYWVKGDVNGDGIVDFQIEVRSSSALIASDFML